MMKKTVARALACGFLLTVVWSFFQFSASCSTLTQSVVRLHVIGNSDSSEDQAVKLQVRDAVLQEASRWVEGEDFQQVNVDLCTHLQSIARAANEALAEQNFPYTATAQITQAFFPTRNYGSRCLPAGTYRTLRVVLGEGQGKNWWCIVFPSLCLPAAEESLDTLPEPGKEVVSHPEEYQIRLKSLELFEELRQWISGK